MSTNQASCSMRLLWKQLRSKLLLYSCLALVLFWLLSLSLLYDCLDMSIFLLLGCSAMYEVVAEAERATFFSWVVSHPLGFRAFAEQSIRTQAFWNDPRLAEKCPSLTSSKERSRSLVFFQTTLIAICWKVIKECLLNDTKKPKLSSENSAEEGCKMWLKVSGQPNKSISIVAGISKVKTESLYLRSNRIHCEWLALYFFSWVLILHSTPLLFFSQHLYV